jgi:hypothetical protein
MENLNTDSNLNAQISNEVENNDDHDTNDRSDETYVNVLISENSNQQELKEIQDELVDAAISVSKINEDSRSDLIDNDTNENESFPFLNKTEEERRDSPFETIQNENLKIANTLIDAFDSSQVTDTPEVELDKRIESSGDDLELKENSIIADDLFETVDNENESFNDSYLTREMTDIRHQVESNGSVSECNTNDQVEDSIITNTFIEPIYSGANEIEPFDSDQIEITKETDLDKQIESKGDNIEFNQNSIIADTLIESIDTNEIQSIDSLSKNESQVVDSESIGLDKQEEYDKVEIELKESILEDSNTLEDANAVTVCVENSDLSQDGLLENEKQIEDLEEKYDLLKTFESEESMFKNKNYFKMASKLDILKNSEFTESEQKTSENYEKSSFIENEEFSNGVNVPSIAEIDNSEMINNEAKQFELNEENFEESNQINENTRTLKQSTNEEWQDENSYPNLIHSSLNKESDWKGDLNEIAEATFNSESIAPSEIEKTCVDFVEISAGKDSNKLNNEKHLKNDNDFAYEESSQVEEPFKPEVDAQIFFPPNETFSKEEDEISDRTNFSSLVENNSRKSDVLDTIKESESFDKLENENIFLLEEQNQSELFDEDLTDTFEKSFTKYEIDDEKILNYEESKSNKVEHFQRSDEKLTTIKSESSLSKSSIRFTQEKVKTNNRVKDKSPITRVKQSDSIVRLNRESPSFSTDSLSANSKSDEKNIVNSIEKADKKFNKWYQEKGLNAVKKVKISTKVEQNKDSLSKKFSPKPSNLKAADSKEVNTTLKNSKSFYLLKNKPVLVPPSLSEVKSKLTKEQLPRRVQNDLILYPRSQNHNLASKSIDPKVSEIQANKVYDKIRVYKKKRWTSESPVKNYINNGKNLPVKRTPLEEINYYNRISLIKNKISQLNRDSSRSIQKEDIPNNRTNRSNPFLIHDSFINDSQKSGSFIFNRKARPLSRDIEEIDNNSFEFLKKFFYLNERLRSEKYSENLDSYILKGESLFKNYSQYPFKRNESFYTKLINKLNNFYLNRVKWIFGLFHDRNYKDKQLNPILNENKLMITDYDDLFRNMKEIDLENKIKYQYVQPNRRNFNIKSQKVADDFNIISFKNVSKYL